VERVGATRQTGRLALTRGHEIPLHSVMSASDKPRLAGRQPSNRGGVPRVMTRLSSRHRLQGKRGSESTGPLETGKPDGGHPCAVVRELFASARRLVRARL